MYETLDRLYGSGRLPLYGLENAVAKGWITEEEKNEIVNNHA